MTDAPQFTDGELQLIADALATHQSYVQRLYPNPIGEHRERLKEISMLRSKAISLIRSGT